MVKTFVEPKYLEDVLKVEVATNWTKQTGLLAATTVPLVIGVVLARAATGEYAPIDFSGTGAAKKAVAVLAANADISTTQQKTVVIARGATVAKDQLVFPVGATEIQIAGALAELDALGIVPVVTY